MGKKEVATVDPVVKVTTADVDALGEVRLKIAALKLQETKLTALLKNAMIVGDTFMTDRFRAELTESNKRILDNEAVRKVLGQKKFNEMAKVAIGELEKVLGKEEIDQVTEGYEPVKTLTVKPIA